MTTKTIDSRGRLTLGPTFANKMMLVQELDGGVVQLIPAEAVPAREAWLFKNPKALASVLKGLEQARKGEFAAPPELASDEDEAEERRVFTVKWTVRAREDFDRISIAAESRRGSVKSSKQEGLYKQVSKTIRLLVSNPRHPGLQTHEFLSLANPFDPAGKVFEAYAENLTPGAYRVFWCYGPGRSEITIVAVTAHP